MRARDLDDNGCLSFDEFLMAMPANIIQIPEEEHRYVPIFCFHNTSLFHASGDEFKSKK